MSADHHLIEARKQLPRGHRDEDIARAVIGAALSSISEDGNPVAASVIAKRLGLDLDNPRDAVLGFRP